MRKYASLSLFIVIVCLISIGCAEQVGKKPNVVFILVDDLGYKDLGYAGSDFYETPAIDGLASKGVVFKRAYAACAVCSPTRASIMTGEFVTGHGVTDWIGAAEGEEWRKMGRGDKLLPANYVHALPHESTSLAECFKNAGYKTFFAGKWHLGGEGSHPEDHGFDINKGGFHRGAPYGGFFSPFKNPKLEDKADGEQLSMRLAKETSQFIASSKDEPFFAFLSFYAVHAPLQTTKNFWEKYRKKAKRKGVREEGFAMGAVLPERLYQDNPVYAGLIEQMDRAVGHVLESLEKHGLDDNTIIVFTSDNGGVLSGDDYASTQSPLKGGKGQAYEGGIRVPCVIYVPWLKRVITSTDVPIMSADFLPTLLSLANMEQKTTQVVDGSDVSSLLTGQLKEDLQERSLYWHYPHYGNQGGKPHSIIMQGNWKLIYFWEDQSSELYEVKTDIGETKNVYEQERERAERMQASLMEWLAREQAKRPVEDELYELQEQEQYLEKMKAVKSAQEKKRKAMYDPDWKPNASWWGSVHTID